MPCNAQTCSGCCTADGKCQNGGQRDECGSGGILCKDCGSQACNYEKNTFPYKYSCGPCGASCPTQFPGQPPQCAADGCGKLCPGAGCDPAWGGTCQLTSTGAAQCSSSEWCDPWSCAGCCVWQGFGSKCVAGNLPSECGSGAVSCVDCVSKGTSCDPNTKSCMACTPSCSASYSCGQGDGCGGKCTGQTGGKCTTEGSICDDDGNCVCGASGQTQCYDSVAKKYVCIDTLGDANNCGGCGVTCPSGLACKNGSCDCGPGKLFCKPPASGGSGVCTNLATDPAHCGSCTTSCPGTTCTDGKCGACPAGKTECKFPTPVCTDLQTDTAHCGTCDTSCPAGIACVAGKCQCPAGTSSCGAECTNVATDAKNCGACGNACPASVSCVAGKCQCPTGTTHCGNVCTNTNVDPNHCGSCNKTCATGFCSNGACL
jgi:hypothetical protein